MLHQKNSPFVLMLVLIFLITACNSRQTSPTPIPTHLPEKTLVPTQESITLPVNTLTPRGDTPVLETATPTSPEIGSGSPETVHSPSLLPPGAVVRFGKGELSALVYSPDGRFLAVGMSIGLCLYEANTLWELWCDQNSGGVHRLAFRADGAGLASVMKDGRVIVWETQTGAQLANRKISSSPFNGLAWTPDGWIITGSSSGDISVWDGATLEKVTTWDRRLGFIMGLFPSPDGRLIAGATWNEVFIWNSETGERTQNFMITPGLNGMGWLPDGETLVTVSGFLGGCGEGCSESQQEGSLAIWNVSTAEQTLQVKAVDFLGQEGWFWGATLNADGTRLAIGTGLMGADFLTSGAILVVDVKTLEILATLSEINPFSTDSFTMGWTPDNRLLIRELDEVGLGGDVLAWTSETGGLELFLTGFTRSAYGLALSPDGRLLAAIEGYNHARVWDAYTGELLRTFQDAPIYIEQLAWAVDRNLLTYSGHSFFGSWDFTTGQGSLLNLENSGYPNQLVWSPTGDRLTLVYSDTVTLLDPTHGELLDTFQFGSYISDFAWAPDGEHIALSSNERGLEIWNVETQQVEKNILVSFAYDLTWTSDSSKLAATTDNWIVIWDVQTGTPLLIIPSPRPQNGINTLAFSPDGSLLASAGHEIILWDATTGEMHATLAGHADLITALAFSPDGKLLYSASYDGSIIVWQVP